MWYLNLDHGIAVVGEGTIDGLRFHRIGKKFVLGEDIWPGGRSWSFALLCCNLWRTMVVSLGHPTYSCLFDRKQLSTLVHRVDKTSQLRPYLHVKVVASNLHRWRCCRTCFHREANELSLKSLLAPQNNQSPFTVVHTLEIIIFVWDTLALFHMTVSLFGHLANTSNSFELAISTKVSIVTVIAVS